MGILKKVYSLQDNYKEPSGLIYPMEVEGTYSICFYIEENEKGTLDNEYEIECILYEVENKPIFNLILTKTTDDIFEVKYRDCIATFRATRSESTYVGESKGPKSPLWVLSVDKKEWEKAQENLFLKYGIVLLGYSEDPRKKVFIGWCDKILSELIDWEYYREGDKVGHLRMQPIGIGENETTRNYPEDLVKIKITIEISPYKEEEKI